VSSSNGALAGRAGCLVIGSGKEDQGEAPCWLSVRRISFMPSLLQ
jgi:hypothetical protein